MMPVYRYLDSHPLQGNQVPLTQYRRPSFEALTPHMMVDLSQSAVMYESWPYVNNIGCSVPCHACCGCSSFPGYCSFRPSCPRCFLPQFQCCGNHPSFHEMFPVQYAPPSHYSIEHQPSHEYDKGVSRSYNNHCCECPNHTYDQRSHERMKIEEQDPAVQKMGENSLVPFQLKNYPYPIVWIPTEHMKNKEHKKPMESEVTSRDKASEDMKPLDSVKPSEMEPRVCNGWFPLDTKGLGSFMPGEDGKRPQNHQYEEKMRQCPVPMI